VQVVGLGKDQGAIAGIASRLFSTLEDHGRNGFDLWALYDFQMEVPDSFRLHEQKLMSGYLHLSFQRGAERIIADRWGLANVTLKRFTLKEWFANQALLPLKRMTCEEVETASGHVVLRYSCKLPLLARLRAVRDARFSLRQVPSFYEAGVWLCPQSNKIYAVQVLRHTRSADLWSELIQRCVCH
jgi:hypothetical protein